MIHQNGSFANCLLYTEKSLSVPHQASLPEAGRKREKLPNDMEGQKSMEARPKKPKLLLE